MTTETAPPQTAKAARWEDLVDVYFAPRDLFARRANESALVPFLMVCAISVILYYVFLPLNALMIEAAMSANMPPGMDAEKMAKGVAFMKYAGGAFLLVGFAFAMLLTAVALKVASSFTEPAAGWRAAFTIAAFSLFVSIPQQILGALMIFLQSGDGKIRMQDTSFGVLRFIEKPDPLLRALLGRLDLFAIWSAILCAIGLMVIVRMPRTKAITAATIAWALLAVPSLVGAALSGQKPQ